MRGILYILAAALAVTVLTGMPGRVRAAESSGETAARASVPEIEIGTKEIPDSAGMALAREMGPGWNLGNTFDAVNCGWVKDKLDYESAWCGVKTSEKLIDALRKAGFRTIRIPVSWHEHVDGEFRIDRDWMERVAEVASWAYDRGMYVILNIHHDCEKGYYYPEAAHAETSEAYMRAIWSQVAERFASWDEHLIFESVNEPRLKGDPKYEWWWDGGNPACREAMAEIVRLNQVFVDTVRAAGGRNGERFLMVPSYCANPDFACAEAFSLPEDPAEGRILVSVHAYTPYDFALEQPGRRSFRLEDSGQKSAVASFQERLYRKFVSRGIPVVIGEFGAMDKDGNLQDRVDWTAWYAAGARARGIPCCWWDNNIFSGTGERFGLMDRVTGECAYPEILEALMKYSGADAPQ